MNRRNFLTEGLVAAATIIVGDCSAFGASAHRYQLAPEAILPEGLRYASDETLEAYRFAAANRGILRYIPLLWLWGAGTHWVRSFCGVDQFNLRLNLVSPSTNTCRLTP